MLEPTPTTMQDGQAGHELTDKEVFKYLQRKGYKHTAATFRHESHVSTHVSFPSKDLATIIDDEELAERRPLMTKSAPEERPRPQGHLYGLGLLPFVDYNIHVPFHIPRIPHSEGAVLWDNLAKSCQGIKDFHKGAPMPPLFWRIFALLLTFILIFGPSLGYASFGAVYTQMKTEFHYTDSQLGFLFSVYSLPTLVAVLFAGVLVDKMGINKCLLLCIILYCLGYIITLGKDYWYLVVGRGLYGLGTESVSVVQDAIVARWYSKDNVITLSLSTAVCMLSYRASSLISMSASPIIYEESGFFALLLAAVVIVLVSGAAGVVLVFVNRKYSDYLDEDGEGEGGGGSLQWSDLLHLGTVFWCINLVTFGMYCSVIPFISFSNEFIINKWNVSQVEAGWMTSTLYLIASVVLLPAGFLIDRWGHRATLLIATTCVPIVAYLLLLETTLTPYVGCMVLGIAHGLLPAVVFPSVALVVEPRLFGTAYGILTFFVNLGLFVSPLYLGFVKDLFGSEDVGEINRWRVFSLILSSVFSLLSAILVFYADWKHGAVLETTCVMKLNTEGGEAVVQAKKDYVRSSKKNY